uniref:Uncharacterized protein n=1 Tax=Rhizophora mucronata TaxID=61149 RepID=A0A2P2N9I8_RHIMU
MGHKCSCAWTDFRQLF